jgi:hypothetical protein
LEEKKDGYDKSDHQSIIDIHQQTEDRERYDLIWRCVSAQTQIDRIPVLQLQSDGKPKKSCNSYVRNHH